MTEGIGWKSDRRMGMRIDFIDVRRAYFHAKARRDVYVALPAEDNQPGMCGKLVKAMYGTRDAAQNWEEEYCDTVMGLGFDRGMASPCAFYHRERNLRVVVHGDDFTFCGLEEDLFWIRDLMSSW